MEKETPPWNTGPLFKEAETIYNVTDIKPYNVKEICSIYNISCKTFFKWSVFFGKEVGPRRGRYYTVRQVEIIFGKLGLPYRVREELD